MRKHRRKIQRKSKKRKRNKRKRRVRLLRHLDAPISNRFTRITTYALMVFEFVFVIWWLQELFLSWRDLILRTKEVFRV